MNENEAKTLTTFLRLLTVVVLSMILTGAGCEIHDREKRAIREAAIERMVDKGHSPVSAACAMKQITNALLCHLQEEKSAQ